MALWYCTDCTAAYSVGAPRCPQCTSTNYTEEEPVAKNSVHMGPSNAVTGEGMPTPRGDGDEVEVVETDSSDVEETPTPDSAVDARELYEAQTVDDLRTELRDRKLAVSGSKPELVDRLVEDDAARAAEAEDSTAVKDAE